MVDLAGHNYHEYSDGTYVRTYVATSKQGHDITLVIQMVTIQGYGKQLKHDHTSSIHKLPNRTA